MEISPGNRLRSQHHSSWAWEPVKPIYCRHWNAVKDKPGFARGFSCHFKQTAPSLKKKEKKHLFLFHTIFLVQGSSHIFKRRKSQKLKWFKCWCEKTDKIIQLLRETEPFSRAPVACNQFPTRLRTETPGLVGGVEEDFLNVGESTNTESLN